MRESEVFEGINVCHDGEGAYTVNLRQYSGPLERIEYCFLVDEGGEPSFCESGDYVGIDHEAVDSIFAPRESDHFLVPTHDSAAPFMVFPPGVLFLDRLLGGAASYFVSRY